MALEAAPGEPPTTGPGSSRNAASHGKLTNGVGGEDMVGNGHPPANGHTFADLRMWFQERLREETTASTTRLRQELSRQLEEYHRELMDAIASAKQLAAARALRQASPEMVTTGCSGIPSSNAGQQLAHILPEPRNLPARSEAGNLPASSEADNAADNAAQDVESEPEVEGGGFAALRKSKHSTSLIFVSGELPDWDPSKSREVSEYSGTTSQVMRKRTKAELAKTMRRKGGPTQYKTGVFAELAHQRKEIKGHFLARIVNSQAFEYASALIIILCTLTMTIEIQYAGLQSGYALSVPSYGKSAADTWPGADFAFQILEPAYNTLFLLELILRIAVMKIAALRSAWIWFDFVLVSLGWLDQFGLLDVGLDPMILRVVRLVRMVRILKVLKQVRAFETLFLLIRSIQASVGALVWSFLLLWTVQIAMAILLCQLLREYIDDPTKDEDLRKEVFKYFGTFTNAVLTMFEITLSNWVITCRLLYDNVSEWYGLLFILYRGCFMFAVVKVITAVFIAETTRCANSDDEIAVVKSQRQKAIFLTKIKEVFNELDSTGDKMLSRAEFERLFHDDLLRTWLSTLEIDTSDMHEFFDVMTEGTENELLSQERFVKGLVRLKGPAKSLDVLKLRSASNQMIHRMEKHERILTAALQELNSRGTGVYQSTTLLDIESKLNALLAGGTGQKDSPDKPNDVPDSDPPRRRSSLPL